MDEVESVFLETDAYKLASHLYWAIWAIIQVRFVNHIVYYLTLITCIKLNVNFVEQARMSPIDFDYLGYFFLRYNEYKKQKPLTFSLVKSHMSASV